jgi:Mg-chelatase subunit ChlI
VTENQVIYPFTAIVGQEAMKEALILNVINPLLGGVLIRGEKGTAKSTAVRALADLLPVRDEVAGCRFSCDPLEVNSYCEKCAELAAAGKPVTIKNKMRVIDLPVSATEDRVVGTLDIEHAIKKGEKKFEPGILAEANRNILYVDEVNLLDDHVVDVLLDAAAMGVNTVEREGISYSHPSRFILIGTMNPEEGDLRPQLIDRFGLVVDVTGEADVEKRMEVVRRRLKFEAGKEAFAASFRGMQRELVDRIERAKTLIKTVTYSEDILRTAAGVAIELGVDGHRADITMVKTAITLAASAGRTEVVQEDMLKAARLALPHRMRRKPFEEGAIDFEVVFKLIGERLPARSGESGLR